MFGCAAFIAHAHRAELLWARRKIWMVDAASGA
jgi:hypothetical protein